MELLTIALIGISLSLDAFSLSLAYGLININKKQIITTSIFVGIFHFFMTLIGAKIGYLIINYFTINPKYVLIIVFILIITEMLKSLNEENNIEHNLNFLNILFFSFLVSIDSFTIGLGLTLITNKIFVSCLIIALLSCFFTFFGFLLGKFFSKKLEKTAKIIGIVIIFTLIIYFLCKL